MNMAFGHTMRQKGCCHLLTLNKHSVQQWLKTFDTIIYDADGVLWHDDKVIEGVPDTFNALRAMGKRPFICTNNSAKTVEFMAKKAQSMGMLVDVKEVVNSSLAVASYLQEQEFHKKVYIIGEEGIASALEQAGIEHLPVGADAMKEGDSLFSMASNMQLDEQVGAVVVGVDKNFSVPKITRAACYLNDPKVLFLGTNPDLAYPVRKGRFRPGAGVMVETVKMVTKRLPLICGKPNPYMCASLLRQGLIKPARTLMVGDTLHTDILLGYNCGFQTLLVGTGVSNLKNVADAQQSDNPKMYQQVPDLYLPQLADLLKFLPSRNG